jgi:hypothetical protein
MGQPGPPGRRADGAGVGQPDCHPAAHLHAHLHARDVADGDGHPHADPHADADSYLDAAAYPNTLVDRNTARLSASG